MADLMIPKGTAQALRDLTGEPRPDVALQLVLRDALAYRLQQIETGLRAFEAKYGMIFEEYRHRWESEDREEDYDWDAERDYLEWEALLTRRNHFEEIASWLG